MPSLTYQGALDYLYSFPDSEGKLPRTPAEFNLPRTAALLAAFGEPQRAFPSVVIAGTKGKGSTAALLEAIARAAGLRTGLWTSPHLHSYRERIQVDRRPISQAELIGAIEAIQPAAGFDRQRYGEPTIFQLGFAIALRYFADQAVDLAILEVGLGGRYDSANVVTPLLSVITSISYDHMAVLGDTLRQDRLGEGRHPEAGCPGDHHPAAAGGDGEIARVAAEVGAPLWVAARRAEWRMPRRNPPFSILHSPFSTRSIATTARPTPRCKACSSARTRGWRPARRCCCATRAADRRCGDRRGAGGGAVARADGDVRGDAADRAGWRAQRRTRPTSWSSRSARCSPAAGGCLCLGTSQRQGYHAILAELAPDRRRAGADALAPPARLDRSGGAGRARRAAAARRAGAAGDHRRCARGARAGARLAGPDDLICVTGSLFVVAAAREALGIALEKD